jgi:hypothetical protein
VLVLAGPAVYLMAQAIYFRVETGTGWRPRILGAALLGIAATPAYWLPVYAVIALQVAALIALAVRLSRDTTGVPIPTDP